MGPAFIVARKDMIEAFRTRTTYIYVVVLFFLALPYFPVVYSAVAAMLKQGLSPAEIEVTLQPLLSNSFETLPLSLTMLICLVLSAYSIVMDKLKRTLESLLATPLSLRQVWIGKSLAVALPGAAVALVVSLLMLLAMNLIIIVPAVGHPVLPTVLSLATGMVLAPLLGMLVVSLVSVLQMIMANPRIANFAFMAIFFVVYFGVYSGVSARLSPSGDFSVAYLIAILLLAAVTYFLSRFLTKERVVLSSKA